MKNNSNLNILSLLIILLLIHGCKLKKDDVKTVNEDYQIKNFILRSNKDNGSTEWKIKSPKATYTQDNKVIKATKPKVSLYDNQDTEKYEITSENLDIYGNGSEIIFKNDVVVKNLLDKDLELSGNKLKWNPNVYTLKFIGESQLRRYNNNFKNTNRINMEVNSNNMIWNSNNGNLQSNSPITATKYNLIRRQKQNFKANSLLGNTDQGYVDLLTCKLHEVGKIVSESNKCRLYWPNNKIGKDSKERSEKIKDRSEEVHLISPDKLVRTTIILPSQEN